MGAQENAQDERRFVVVSDKLRGLLHFSNVLFSLVGDECTLMSVDKFFRTDGIARTTLVFFDVDGQDEHYIERFKLEGAHFLRHLVIVFINVEDRNNHRFANICPNCRGLFSNQAQTKEYQNGLTKLLDDEVWFSRSLCSRLLLARNDCHPSVNPEKLNVTQREITLLYALMDGATNAQLADRLFISPHTVKAHLYHIYKKINVSNRSEAVSWAYSNLLKPHSEISR